MFSNFANVWTPLIEAKRVGRTPLRVELAGEGLVVFRGERGEIGVLQDRCPHRSVRLSLGTVGDDGCLQCPFHGWRFAPDGENRHVPLNPDAKRSQLNATSLPARVIGDLVWVYTSPLGQPAESPQVPEGLDEAGLTRTYITRTWHCHWTRAMENMLDSPHLPFVHRRSIGRGLARKMKPDSRMDISWEDTSFGGRSIALMDGVDGGGRLEFFRPNVMALTIPMPGRHFRIHALVIPVNESETRLVVATSRNFLRPRLFNLLFQSSSRKIADEDRAVVESSPPGEVPPPGHEQSVATDKATLKFRHYYHRVLRHSAC
ncbi:MAG: aromatic ring-hydroxylating dioxygenase subunit alpha [Pseudomonadales bacterium]|nr:aromatic ring-hydroxylating dioxygenase subunit alpha [Pseudomonadales bacterium]